MKRKVEAPEEAALSRKRISLDVNSRPLLGGANDSDVGLSRVQEQVWMVQWYTPRDLFKLHFSLIMISICIGGIHNIKNIKHGMVMAFSL